jgi:hypothetical protein
MGLFSLLILSSAVAASVNAFTFRNIRTQILPVVHLSSQDVTVPDITRRSILAIPKTLPLSAAIMASLILPSGEASARLDPVNRPDLLPKEPNLNVIQTEKFLTSGQVKRMNDMLTNLERDTGFRLRVLCQSYPNTPGLAIRDYWSLGKEVSLA